MPYQPDVLYRQDLPYPLPSNNNCCGNPPSQEVAIPRHFQLEKGLDKAKLNTLVDSYESSRKILSDMIDLDSIANAKTTEVLLQKLTLLAKVLKAEGALREEFLNNLKKLGE
jgi:hypothetical protein